VPDSLSLLRLVALIVIIALVAVGLWLLDAGWWVVAPVMAGALLIAWTIEWVAWRGSSTTGEARPTTPPQLPAEGVAPSESLPRRVVPPHEPAPEVSEPEPTPASPEELPARVADEPATVARAEEEQPAPASPADPRRPRRFRLRSVPPARPEPVPAAEPSPPEAVDSVVELRPRTTQPREWNLWDLERIAREEAAEHPERRDEWVYLFLNLRQFARADGSLPAEFDPLVRESFGGLLERPRGV
jgi:hypothetical protein